MYNFSICIGDEIADDFAGKIHACGKLLFSSLEVSDCFDGRSIIELSGEDIEYYRHLLIEYQKKIVLLSVKWSAGSLDYFRKVFRNAHLLGIENIRISMEGLGAAEPFKEEAYKEVCGIGKAYGIGVLLENDSKSFLSSDEAISGVYGRIKGEFTGLIFNPLEFARMKTHPFFHVFYNSKRKNDIRFLRINDGLFVDGSPAIPGSGNAEIKELASILLTRSYKGFFSFVPYFEKQDLEKTIRIINAFKKLLREM